MIDMDSNPGNYCHYSDLPSPLAYMDVDNTSSANSLSDNDINRIIEMAWEDRTTFDAIQFQFGLNESDVKTLMQRQLRFSSYKRWRKRVESCKTKHAKSRVATSYRFKSNLQRTITNNKISKRRNK
jgi:uncharacterized protein (TIGR03643 family)